jgi:WD40 repeat protein/tRNA A-37 threonylcarbamoyl transferase component Bud32
MRPPTLAHPARELLSAYGLGQLDEADSVPIEEHLDACAGCRAIVEAVPDDAVASLVREAAPRLAALPAAESGNGAARPQQDGELLALWRQGERPDVWAFLAGAGPLPPEQVLAVLVADQQERWQRGERAWVEEYLEKCPALAERPESALELIYGEFLLREQRGESPRPEEYVRRFPAFAARLEGQFHWHQALGTLPPAQRDPGGETLPGPAGAASGWPNLPDHEIVGELGRGGMGVVYLARHRLSGRREVLKVMNRECLRRPGSKERFLREIQSAALLDHPHVVKMYTALEVGDRMVLVMEYVAGVDLDRLVKGGGPLPVATACDYARQCALGLEHAHERGLVHRDIKPSNLMLTAGGQVKVLDFGLALLASETAAGGLTDTGVVMGTADYIAPEQAEDPHRAVIRADLYSLGCTLYFLLTGQPPFPEGNCMQKVMAHSQHTPRPLAEFRNDLPPGLEQVVGRMMAKCPAQRYQTPGEAARAFARFAPAEGARGTATALEALPRGEADFATESLPAVSRPRRRRRLRQMIAAALAVLLVGAGLFGLVIYRITSDKGEVVIETDDSDVEVVVTQGGKEVTILDPRSRQKVTLDTGEYTVRLAGNPDGLKIDMPETFTLRRGDTKIVTVKRVEEKVGEVRCINNAHMAFGGVLGVALSRDGRRAFTCGNDWCVRMWDLKSRREVWRFRSDGQDWCVRDVALSPDGRHVLVGGHDHTVRLLDAATGKEVRRFVGHKAFVNGVSFSSTGRLALSAGGTWVKEHEQDNTVRLWDVATGKELRCFEGHTAWVRTAVFSPNDRLVLSASLDRTLRLWDAATGKKLRRLEGHTDAVLSAVFSPDGRQVLSSSGDRTVRLWDVETGKELRRLVGHTGLVETVVVSQDGRRALSASHDGTVRLWDIATGDELYRCVGHTGEVHAAVLSADGRYAFSSGRDGTVRLWRLPDPPPPQKDREAHRPK